MPLRLRSRKRSCSTAAVTEIVHHFETAFGQPPTWQSLADGSLVKGKKLQSVAQTGTIPWLLLKGTATNEADGAVGLLSRVTYVQRLDTAGGAAPAATDCSDAAHVSDVGSRRLHRGVLLLRGRSERRRHPIAETELASEVSGESRALRVPQLGTDAGPFGAAKT